METFKIEILPNGKGRNAITGEILPLTSHNDNVGGVGDGEKVDQFMDAYGDRKRCWMNVTESYTLAWANEHVLNTRTAYHLTPVKEGEEKPVSKETLHTDTVVATPEIETLSNEEFDRQYKEEFGIVATPDVEEKKSVANEYLLICNFMEYKIKTHSAYWLVTNFNFKKSWDELMPVIQQIRKVCLSESGDTDKMGVIFRAIYMCHIKTAYEACLQFIQWYNLKNK